jgi:hypothetical protein
MKRVLVLIIISATVTAIFIYYIYITYYSDAQKPKMVEEKGKEEEEEEKVEGTWEDEAFFFMYPKYRYYEPSSKNAFQFFLDNGEIEQLVGNLRDKKSNKVHFIPFTQLEVINKTERLVKGPPDPNVETNPTEFTDLKTYVMENLLKNI